MICMIPMTGDSEKLEYFITDVRREENQLVVVYANNRVEKSPFSEHNLNVIRSRMIDQVRNYLDDYYKFIAEDVSLTLLKKYGSIIAGIVGLFFLYNVDIHTIMKIIITILGLAGEVIYYFVNNIHLSLLGMGVMEADALQYYVDNLKDFKEYNSATGLDEYIVPIEDISKHNLTKEMLEELSIKIREFKEQGTLTSEMKLTYKPQTKTEQEK